MDGDLRHDPSGPNNRGGVAAFSYVLPLATDQPRTEEEFVAYLAWLGRVCELIVADGSPPEVFAAHDQAWGALGRHVRPEETSLVGKVANVMTGVRLAKHDRVIIADDDIRFGTEILELVDHLDRADVVRPQNFFDPLPWHAVWDSGRTLFNRALGGDWPGTLAIRRSVLLEAGGYSGDVMFENFELVKTIETAGGRLLSSDLFVRRLPPTTSHFFSQRVRQAYDELARPERLVPFLAVIPMGVSLAITGHWPALRRSVLGGALAIVAIAEYGRRRGGAQEWFPARCALAAPVWVAERSLCVWLALAARARGGVRYRGHRIAKAALRPVERRQRIATYRRAASIVPL